jgi:hypothetical protein
MLAPELKNVLDQRIQEDENIYIPGTKIMDDLRKKYNV